MGGRGVGGGGGGVWRKKRDQREDANTVPKTNNNIACFGTNTSLLTGSPRLTHFETE